MVLFLSVLFNGLDFPGKVVALIVLFLEDYRDFHELLWLCLAGGDIIVQVFFANQAPSVCGPQIKTLLHICRELSHVMSHSLLINKW